MTDEPASFVTDVPAFQGGASPAPSLRLLVVVDPRGPALPPTWVPAGASVRITAEAEATRLASEADVVLLHAGAGMSLARELRDRLPGRVLLWTVRPEPALEARAAELGLGGTIPLDVPALVDLTLARALALGRHAPRPARRVRWRWDAACDELEVPDARDLGIPADAVRAVLREAAAAHRDQEAAHFQREQLVRVGERDVWMGVHGRLARSRDGALVVDGTVAVIPTAQERRRGDDPLTGLPGRAAFVEHLAALRERTADAPRHAVLCLDLDNLTALNDGLGHEVGDLLLRWTADRLRELLPRHLVARVGSDEFVVLFDPVTEREQVQHTSEQVLAELTSSVFLAGHLVYPSAKAGLAFGERLDAGGISNALRDAQSALGRAKASRSTGLVVFSGEMRRRHLAAVRLDHDLRHAVATGELDVHFQPIVDLPSRRVQGFEALLRWHHPRRGAVPPSEFVPHAERNGLILQIGQWVLHRASDAVRELHARHPELADVYVSVNLSPLQLRQPDLVEQVERALAEAGLAPRSLRLELTENAVMSNAEPTLDLLHRLRALGVQVLLDDFGTGYSALQHLVRLPADVLKIDRSFVDGLGVDPRRTRVVCTIVDLARSLGMALVAEGVETAEQLAWLEELGVEAAQGYLLGAPAPPHTWSADALLGVPASGRVLGG